MAAAAHGFAARSLRGGVLGQTRTRVVELGQRRLMPRSIQTKRNICTGGNTEKDVVMKRIDKAKEELFDLSAEAHKMYWQDPEPACRNNLELLRDPFHPVWNVAMGARLRHDAVQLAGTYGLVIVASIGGTYVLSEAIMWAAGMPSPRDE